MDHSRFDQATVSPDDTEALRRWRRSVCIFYAVLYVILAAVWSMQQIARGGDEGQAAGATKPAAEARSGESLSPLALCTTSCGD